MSNLLSKDSEMTFTTTHETGIVLW